MGVKTTRQFPKGDLRVSLDKALGLASKRHTSGVARGCHTTQDLERHPDETCFDFW
jgi:hypothetical protein